MTGNSHKLSREILTAIRKKNIKMRVVKHWNMFPKDVVKSPSLQISKS